MSNYTDAEGFDIDEEDFDMEQSLSLVAHVAGNESLKDYEAMKDRKVAPDALSSAKLVSNMMHELQYIIAYTPCLSERSQTAEHLRESYLSAVGQLNALREMFVFEHEINQTHDS